MYQYILLTNQKPAYCWDLVLCTWCCINCKVLLVIPTSVAAVATTLNLGRWKEGAILAAFHAKLQGEEARDENGEESNCESKQQQNRLDIPTKRARVNLP